VQAKVATWGDLRDMTRIEILDANDWLDAHEEAQWLYQKENANKTK
jgi:hypothetical protein